MIEIEPFADTPELGSELRAVMPVVDEVAEDGLVSRFREFVSVGEFFLALEILVALGRMHPPIAREITNRFPQADKIVESEIVAEYCSISEHRPAGSDEQ